MFLQDIRCINRRPQECRGCAGLRFIPVRCRDQTIGAWLRLGSAYSAGCLYPTHVVRWPGSLFSLSLSHPHDLAPHYLLLRIVTVDSLSDRRLCLPLPSSDNDDSLLAHSSTRRRQRSACGITNDVEYTVTWAIDTSNLGLKYRQPRARPIQIAIKNTLCGRFQSPAIEIGV